MAPSLIGVPLAFCPVPSPYWLMGRVGLVSLGQIALLAVAGWVALRLGFATSLPFPVLLLLTGAITAATADVLRNEQVIRAYLGTDDTL
jgi:ABC-type branched-subunit amino acid transport system permease subunit